MSHVVMEDVVVVDQTGSKGRFEIYIFGGTDKCVHDGRQTAQRCVETRTFMARRVALRFAIVGGLEGG